MAPASPLGGALLAILAAGSLLFVAAYLRVALARLSYPYELEWIEGGVLEHVRRVVHGQPLYGPPTLQFTALNYAPLYYWAAAPLSAALGDGFMPLRLLSVICSLAAFALLFVLVWRESGRAWAGVLAAGLFAAVFRLGGAWFDVARADSLYMALMLGGATALRLDRSPRRSGIAGAALFALAFFAKQSAVAVAAPLALWLLWKDRTRGVTFALAFAALTGAGLLALQLSTGGWFFFYAFHVAGSHSIDPSRHLLFLIHDVAAPLWPALIVAAVPLLSPATRPGLERAGFLLAFGAGLFGSAWALRLYPVTFDNINLTAYLAIALAAALGFAGWLARGDRPSAARAVTVALAALLAFQLVSLRWPMSAELPTARDRAEGDALIARVRTLPPRVFIPAHGYLATRAGKPPQVHFMALLDVLNAGEGPVERGMWATLRDSLRAHAWDALILDRPNWLMDEALAAGYRPVASVFPDTTSMFPLTGNRTRPEVLLIPPPPPSAH
jgi:hypothetical protein